jgi:hypothetical protein
MVPRRQGHGGQLKLVLDRVALFCRNPLPLLLPPLAFLPLPLFYDEAMPPKKWTRLALKTDGVKTRAAGRKELTRR